MARSVLTLPNTQDIFDLRLLCNPAFAFSTHLCKSSDFFYFKILHWKRGPGQCSLRDPGGWIWDSNKIWVLHSSKYSSLPLDNYNPNTLACFSSWTCTCSSSLRAFAYAIPKANKLLLFPFPSFARQGLSYPILSLNLTPGSFLYHPFYIVNSQYSLFFTQLICFIAFIITCPDVYVCVSTAKL